MALVHWFLFLILAPVALVIILSLTVLYYQIKEQMWYKKSGCNIPRSRFVPVLGSYPIKEIHQMQLDLFAKGGLVHLNTLFHMPIIFVGDADIVQYILSKHNFPKAYMYANLRDFWGPNVVTMQHGEGGPWKYRRSLVDPAFARSSLRLMNATFAFQAHRFTEFMLAHQRQQMNFYEVVQNLTMDVISSAGFSLDLGALEGRGSFMVTHLQIILGKVNSPMLVGWNGGKALKTLNNKRLTELFDFLGSLVDARLEELATSGGKAPTSRNRDLLDLLVLPNDQGKQLTKEEICNELFVFFLAGYETTSNILGWFVYELCRHPEVEARLVRELEEVMGPRVEGKIDTPTLEQLDQLTYLTMVINEILRLYPPTTTYNREVPETFELKGYVFPKGYMIAPSAFLIQRNPEYWPEPERFDPERFTKENSEGRHPFAFIPFSAGPRVCIGKSFFYQEAKMIAATLYRQVRFSLVPGKTSGVMTSKKILIQPNAVWVTAEARPNSD